MFTIPSGWFMDVYGIVIPTIFHLWVPHGSTIEQEMLNMLRSTINYLRNYNKRMTHSTNLASDLDAFNVYLNAVNCMVFQSLLKISRRAPATEQMS